MPEHEDGCDDQIPYGGHHEVGQLQQGVRAQIVGDFRQLEREGNRGDQRRRLDRI